MEFSQDKDTFIPPSEAINLLFTLPAPTPYTISIDAVNISAPVPSPTIPFTPISIPTFIQRFKSKNGNNSPVGKELVRGVSINITPGEVCAIVGGSGSGKTTLLNCVAGRMGGLILSSGSITFNPLLDVSSEIEPSVNTDYSLPPALASSMSSTSPKLNRILGYVPQADQLVPYITVLETLQFAASLRLPKSVSKEMKAKIIEQTMIELGLKDAEHIIVGGALGGKKGISGGERRRLSIGCVLVTLPSILVLDEPTSGLDSFTAYQLLETLSNLARRGRTVIMSIHQPRSDALPFIDKVLLLSGGSNIYAGPNSKMLSYFKESGHVPSFNTNPMDFVVDVTSIDTRDDESEATTRAKVGKMILSWKSYELQTALWKPYASSTESSEFMASRLSESTLNGFAPGKVSFDVPSRRDSGSEKKRNSSESIPAFLDSRRSSMGSLSTLVESEKGLSRPSFWTQTVLLTGRGLTSARRNWGQSLGFLIQTVVIGLVLGLCFFQIPETLGGIQSLKTLSFVAITAVFYPTIIIFVYLLTEELKIFDKERTDHLYNTLPALTGLWISYLPINIFFPSLYVVFIYFLCGLWKENLAGNFLSLVGQCILQQLCSFGYALLAASMSRSFATASLIANGFAVPLVLASGYVIVDLPVWVFWTKWLSPYFYGFHWTARLQFLGREFTCDGLEGFNRIGCSGTNVLRGMHFPLATPIYVYPLGLVGFVIVTQTLSALILHFYKPGGMVQATQMKAKPRRLRTEIRVDENRSDEAKERIDILVRGLGLSVESKGFLGINKVPYKAILYDIDAFFPAGEVSVIMGPSGSGKSTLLQVLSGRITASKTFCRSGDILLNGIPYKQSMASLLAFIEQGDDYHMATLTVQETLKYAAYLSMPFKSKAECSVRAEEVLRKLGLKLCANNLVGGKLIKGISGGEKRRLSLAVQLLADPAIIFADEPLTGLDAYTARNVMQTLKDIADTGRTVVIVAHQPSSDLWNLFDNVLLLAKGGRTAFSGRRQDILKVFEENGAVCPPNFNPADFVIDSISVNTRSVESEKVSRVVVAGIVSTWMIKARANRLLDNTPRYKGFNVIRTRLTAPFHRSIIVLLTRSFKNLRRQPSVAAARLINPPFLAMLFLLYFGRFNYDPASAQSRVGLLQENTAIPFIGMISCIAIFTAEKNLFLHEWRTAARQSVFVFLVTYSIQEMISSLISSLLYSIVVVYGIGLQHQPQIFLEYWLSIFALLSTGESIGIVFSSFCNSGGLVVSIVSTGLTLLSQLNGITSVTLPHWLELIGWISPMRFTSRIQILNEMTGLVFDCTESDISSGVCIFPTGEALLATFNIDVESTNRYLVLLGLLLVLYRCLAYLALLIKIKGF